MSALENEQVVAPANGGAREARSRSRRALLVGALGGIGAWAAAAAARVSPVRAANNDPVLVGNAHTGSGTTQITNSTNGNVVFRAASTSSGIGLRGASQSFYGVYGTSNTSAGVFGEATSGTGVAGTSTSNAGVYAQSATGSGVMARSSSATVAAAVGRGLGHSTGVLGHSGNTALPTAPKKTGVYGHATQDDGSRGVWGRANSGQGVRGQATSGVGLYGKASSGYALRTSGRTRFSTSGLATISAGSTSVTVTPGVNVTSTSFVLLTPKTNIGSRALWFTTNATADTFTIRMGSSRSSSTRVAWLLLG